MSISEQASNDLRVARLLLHRFGDTFKDIRSHCFSIMTLGEQWQLLQNSFATVYNSLEKRVKEVVEKERELAMANNRIENSLEEVALRQKKMDFEEKFLKERIEGVELREKQIKDWCECLEFEKRAVIERCNAVERREKKFMEGFERVKAVDVEEKKVEERRRAVEERLRVVEEGEKEVKEAMEEIEKREMKIVERGDALDVREKEVNLKEGVLEEKEGNLKELELKEKDMDEKSQVLVSKEKILRSMEEEIEEQRKGLELKEEEIHKRCQVFDAEEKRIQEREVVVGLKEKEMNEKGEILVFKEKILGVKEEEIKEKRKELELKEKQIQERQGDMKLKYNDMNSRSKYIVSSSLRQVSKEPPGSDIAQVACDVDSFSAKSGVDIHSLCRTMDSEGVRSYLIKHVKELDILYGKILDALRHAPDPGKLVFDTFQTFHLKFAYKSQKNANKSICIFLLELLMKLSLRITPELKNDATNFAAYLKAKLKENNSPKDNFGFLQFLATYNLAHLYNADELLSYFKILYCGNDVYRPKENLYLCRVLGFSKKIPGLVKSLINGKKWLLAVKYICVFELENNFPLVPLLKDHLDFLKKRVNDIQKNGSFKSKIEAESMELSCLRDVLKCITYFKLESKFPPHSVLSRIKELEKAKEKKKRNAGNWPSKQLEKRARMGNNHQVAPLDRDPCPQPMPHSFGHSTTPILPIVQSTCQQGTLPISNALSCGAGPYFGPVPPSAPPPISPPPFLPPGGVNPFGPPLPFHLGEHQACAAPNQGI